MRHLALLLVGLIAAFAALNAQEVRFASPIVFPSSGPYPTGIAAGDFNNDGIPDLLVGDDAANSAVALGVGNGDFGPWLGGCGNGYVVSVGKFDGANLGALCNNVDKSEAILAFGQGDGSFSGGDVLTVNELTTVTSFASADFNLDGNLDLVLVSAGQNWPVGQVAVYLGNGDGTFQNPAVLTRGTGPVAVSTGDFNGDGNPDIAVLTQDFGDFGGYVAVFLGNGRGHFGQPLLFRLPKNHGSLGFSPFVAMALGDFNSDGKLDAAVAIADYSTQPSYVAILLGNGDGTFRKGQLALAGPNPLSIAVADLNGDGVPDIAAVNPSCLDNGSHGCVAVLLGNGDGTFQEPNFFEVGGESPESLAVADFNGDGKPDVATANGDSGSISVLLNTTQFPNRKAGSPKEGKK